MAGDVVRRTDLAGWAGAARWTSQKQTTAKDWLWLARFNLKLHLFARNLSLGFSFNYAAALLPIAGAHYVPIPDGRHLAKQPFADGKEVDNRSLIVPTKWQFAIRLLCRGADFGE